MLDPPLMKKFGLPLLLSLCWMTPLSGWAGDEAEKGHFSVWDIPGAHVLLVPATAVAIPAVIVGTVVIYGVAKTTDSLIRPFGYAITYSGRPLPND